MKAFTTEDGNHGASIIQNGKDGAYMAFATQEDGNGGFEYWYTIGTYKTEASAIKYAARSLNKHGYKIKAA